MVYGLWYVIYKHKDPRIVVSGIPTVLCLRARMWDAFVYVVFGAPKDSSPTGPQNTSLWLDNKRILEILACGSSSPCGLWAAKVAMALCCDRVAKNPWRLVSVHVSGFQF